MENTRLTRWGGRHDPCIAFNRLVLVDLLQSTAASLRVDWTVHLYLHAVRHMFTLHNRIQHLQRHELIVRLLLFTIRTVRLPNILTYEHIHTRIYVYTCIHISSYMCTKRGGAPPCKSATTARVPPTDRLDTLPVDSRCDGMRKQKKPAILSNTSETLVCCAVTAVVRLNTLRCNG